MELPKGYKNWIELAKGCIELEKEHGGDMLKKIKLDYHGNISEYVINDIKAKAFDEVIKKVSFSKDHINTLKYAALNAGADHEDIMLIINPLLDLSD